MNTETNYGGIPYPEYLKQKFAEREKAKQAQANAVTSRFSPKSKIEEELERVNREHSISLSPKVRLKKAIDSLNSKTARMAIDVRYTDAELQNLNEDQLQAAKNAQLAGTTPPVLKLPTVFASTATHNNKSVPMSIEVKY